MLYANSQPLQHGWWIVGARHVCGCQSLTIFNPEVWINPSAVRQAHDPPAHRRRRPHLMAIISKLPFKCAVNHRNLNQQMAIWRMAQVSPGVLLHILYVSYSRNVIRVECPKYSTQDVTRQRHVTLKHYLLDIFVDFFRLPAGCLTNVNQSEEKYKKMHLSEIIERQPTKMKTSNKMADNA